jgi:hypothetical protein
MWFTYFLTLSPFPKVCALKRLKGVGEYPYADPRGRPADLVLGNE